MSETPPPPKKKKKSSPPDEGGGADFMALFCALSVILLAFFILLTTMAVQDDSKKRKALGSVFGSFGIMPSGKMFDKDGESLHNSNRLIDQISAFDRLIQDVHVLLREQGLMMDKTVARFKRGGLYPRLTLSNQIFYTPGGTEIAPNAFPILDRLAEAAKEMGGTLVVEGHTSPDPLPPESMARGHWELSTHRAVRIQRYLIEASKLDASKVHAEGHAFYHPDVGENRIVIVFQHPTARQKDLERTPEPEDDREGSPDPEGDAP